MVPPKGWGHLDGVALVVRGTGGSGGGKRVQIARARLKQWCPRTEDRSLAALQATCNVKASCAEVGMWPPSAYAHRERWPRFRERWYAAVETGYLRLEMALIENGKNLFSGRDLPPEAPMPQMRVADAIHLLHMHKREVRGVGGRPGLIARDPDIEEVRAQVLRKVGAMERGRRRVSAADRARDRAEWARRSG